MIVITMLYNVKISRQNNDENASLSYVKNTAQAQTENPGQKVLTKTTDDYNDVVTYVDGSGQTCVSSTPTHVVECSGQGSIDCVPVKQPTGPTVTTCG